VNVRLAAWAEPLKASVAASIYALPPQDRVWGARAAHAAGHWVHADVILQQGPGMTVVNIGVDVEQIKEGLRQVPDMRLDVHLMVLPGTRRWEQAVDQIASALAGTAVTRWSAVSAVLDRLKPRIQVDCEKWVEVWLPRDGAIAPTEANGVLAMLIEPGTKGLADPAMIEMLSSLSRGARVGVDGGVTPSLASMALTAGASYLVVGRALFEANEFHSAGESVGLSPAPRRAG
jgi:pentose-5-phosphate-3-epimerase